MTEQQVLMQETIDEIDNYLPKMLKGIDLFIEYIMEAKEKAAQEVLSGIFEGLEWIVQAINLTKKMQQDKMEEKALVEKLPLLIDAYENKDMILISDILDYEIKPIIEKWANMIN